MCEIGRGCSRPLRLTFRHIDPDPHSPRNTEDRHEDIDRDNNDPTARSGVGVNRVSGVKRTDQNHRNAESKATVNRAVTATPFVGKKKSGNGDAEDNDG